MNWRIIKGEIMKVKFLDLALRTDEEFEIINNSIKEVLRHGMLVMGPEMERFESEIAKYCGRKYAVGVGSGTDALYFSLRALDIGAGDEVITTSLSWIATANAIALTGATPVFADIQEDLNICPKSIEGLITSKTKAILFVNYTGRICDCDELIKISKKYKLKLVEDGSQSFGAEYNYKKSGSFGDITAFSHNPMKVFAACGEAGSILCDDNEIRNRLISLRYNGTINKEICVEPSINGRLDTIQAAVLLARLPLLPKLINRRRKIAEYYNSEISKYVKIPPEYTITRQDVYYTYTIKTKNRDNLKLYLEEKNIETKIQHPYLMSNQPAYNKNKSNNPMAEKIVSEILCIPIHEKLTDSMVNYVSETIKDFFKR
jgi:dTDP-4-amino-4,6-dideoxygalactose transaminase